MWSDCHLSGQPSGQFACVNASIFIDKLGGGGGGGGGRGGTGVVTPYCFHGLSSWMVVRRHL